MSQLLPRVCLLCKIPVHIVEAARHRDSTTYLLILALFCLSANVTY
jgi:hypothetical protein